MVSVPKVSFCQKGKVRLVTLSVDKEKFLNKIRLTILDKIEVTENLMLSFKESYNEKKYSFNKEKLEEFENEIIEIESLNSILTSNPRLFKDEYKTQKVIEVKSMFNELSKLVDSFDREMMEIDELIVQKNYKSAYQKISSLSNFYDLNSNIGKQISAQKSKIKEIPVKGILAVYGWPRKRYSRGGGYLACSSLLCKNRASSPEKRHR